MTMKLCVCILQGQVWWLLPEIPALRLVGWAEVEVGCEFETSLAYMVRSSQLKHTKPKTPSTLFLLVSTIICLYSVVSLAL